MGHRKLIQALNTEALVTGWKTVTRQTGDSHMTNIIHVHTYTGEYAEVVGIGLNMVYQWK